MIFSKKFQRDFFSFQLRKSQWINIFLRPFTHMLIHVGGRESEGKLGERGEGWEKIKRYKLQGELPPGKEECVYMLVQFWVRLGWKRGGGAIGSWREGVNKGKLKSFYYLKKSLKRRIEPLVPFLHPSLPPSNKKVYYSWLKIVRQEGKNFRMFFIYSKIQKSSWGRETFDQNFHV